MPNPPSRAVDQYPRHRADGHRQLVLLTLDPNTQPPRIQHDHLVDVDTGEVIEIQSDEMAALRRRIAAEHGYEIVEHRTVIRGKRA